MTEPEVLVIVDGYSTGRYVPEIAGRHDIRCVHVQSSETPPDFFERSFVTDAYLAHLIDQGDVTTLAAEIRRLGRPLGVLAGVDTGTALRDKLAAALHLPGNTPDSSAHRRDKYAMAEALQSAGLRSIRHRLISDVSALPAALDTLGGFPMVVKPVNSAGTDGVRIVASLNDARSAVLSIIGRKNALGADNHYALLQEYIDGTEYIVNTVSINGKHKIIDAWRCEKLIAGAYKLYDVEVMIDPAEPEVNQVIRPYLFAMLAALRIQQGPAHTELMVDADGPVLIETGARLHGSIDPSAVSRCINTNHPEAAVAAMIDPATFEASVDNMAKPRQMSLCIGLISKRAGVIEGEPGIDAIRALPSFHSLRANYQRGKSIPETRDLLSCPGIVYLVGEDQPALWRDYRRVRDIEHAGLFTFAEGISQ